MIFSWKNGVLKLALKQINNIFWINKVLRSVSSQTWHHVGPVNRKEFLFSENQSDSTPGALAGGANLRSPVNWAPYGRFRPHCPAPFCMLSWCTRSHCHITSSHLVPNCGETNCRDKSIFHKKDELPHGILNVVYLQKLKEQM